MKQRFIVVIEHTKRVPRASIEEAITKEIAPWNVTITETEV